MVEEINRAAGDKRPIEVKVQCQEHPADGVLAMYEDGLIVFGCVTCHKFVGQAEISNEPRPWGKSTEAMN